MSLAAIFMNGGFYGIPVCMLAFGDIGVVYATTFVVCTSFLQATLGIFLANAGSRTTSEAFATVFKVPLVYAIVGARLLDHLDLLPPEPFMTMIDLLGKAAIPIGLLLLGLQLDRIIAGLQAGRVVSGDEPPLGRMEIAGGLVAAVLRLGGGFGLALIILSFFDFEPTVRAILIVESAMPTAVAAVVYATEFDCKPRLVTIGILVSTLLSVVTVALVLGYVR
jgi:predicted permease